MQDVKIQIPYGWEFVRIGRPEKGDHFLKDVDVVEQWTLNVSPQMVGVIVRPASRWEDATIQDIYHALSGNKVEARFWEGERTESGIYYGSLSGGHCDESRVTFIDNDWDHWSNCQVKRDPS